MSKELLPQGAPGPGLPTRDITFWDVDNPNSVINLVPQHVKHCILAAYQVAPDLFGEEERSLHKQIAKLAGEPTPTDNRIRLKFWHEYDRAFEENDKMNMAAVCGGLCSREYFMSKYLKRPEFVAWMLCPPANYFTKMEEGLEFGIEQLRDILSLPLRDASGKVDSRIMELKVKIVAMMDLRVKGAVPLKVEQKTLSYNVNSEDVQRAIASNSMEEIEERIRELEAQDRWSKRMDKISKSPTRDDNGVIEDADISEPRSS